MAIANVLKELARLDRAESLVKKSIIDFAMKERLLLEIAVERSKVLDGFKAPLEPAADKKSSK